jgi:hypothetical protein
VATGPGGKVLPLSGPYAGRSMNDGTLLAGVDLGSNSYRLEIGRPAKKSEMLRAGIKALAGMNDAALVAALAAVPAIETGRPAGK